MFQIEDRRRHRGEMRPPLMELDQIKFLLCCLALWRFPESPPENRKLLKRV